MTKEALVWLKKQAISLTERKKKNFICFSSYVVDIFYIYGSFGSTCFLLLVDNSFFSVFPYICMILLSWFWCLYFQFTFDYIIHDSCWGPLFGSTILAKVIAHVFDFDEFI
jgi:hypothetical protein